EELLAIESADAPLPTSLRDVFLAVDVSTDHGGDAQDVDRPGVQRAEPNEQHVAQRRWQGSVRRLDREQLLGMERVAVGALRHAPTELCVARTEDLVDLFEDRRLRKR